MGTFGNRWHSSLVRSTEINVKQYTHNPYEDNIKAIGGLLLGVTFGADVGF